MKVTSKKTEDEVRRELFGPIQQAAALSYNPGAEASDDWCELSELRLLMLLIKFKPAGDVRQFNMLALVDFMSRVYDTEGAEVEMFVLDEDRAVFRAQQRLVQFSKEPRSVRRMIFPPRYRIRPTVRQVRLKIDELYEMKEVEKNEMMMADPHNSSDFFLPDGDYSEMMRKKEDAPAPGKRRRFNTPDD